MSPEKIKKFAYLFFVYLLLAGAIASVGFLSFGGMYAIVPLISLAAVAFVLSVLYEGEIFLKNILSSLLKLFAFDYLQQDLADQFLRDYYLHDEEKIRSDEEPAFFEEFLEDLRESKTLKSHIKNIKLVIASTSKGILESDTNERQLATWESETKELEKRLHNRKQWFARVLFLAKQQGDAPDNLTPYQKAVFTWLRDHKSDALQTLGSTYDFRRGLFSLLRGLSSLCAVSMGVATTYLLAEQFTTLGFIGLLSTAAGPAIIIPISIVAGVAFGLMIYNATTDMVQHETVQRWFQETKNQFLNQNVLRSVGQVILAVGLIVLAGILTFCTVGTWQTVVRNAKPVMGFFSQLPATIIGMVPVITGLGQFIFISQNTLISLRNLFGNSEEEHHHEHGETENEAPNEKGRFTLLKELFSSTVTFKNENFLQIINPFRFIHKVLFSPLNLLLFFGHILSIAVMADRVPGFPKLIAIFSTGASELVEDWHYFVPHAHKHAKTDNDLVEAHFGYEEEHNHEDDLPKKAMKALFRPIEQLAIYWDVGASYLNTSENRLTVELATKKYSCVKEPKKVKPYTVPPASNAWVIERVIDKVERIKEEHFGSVYFEPELRDKKVAALGKFQDALRAKAEEAPKDTAKVVRKLAKAELKEKVYAEHRFRLWGASTYTCDQIKKFSTIGKNACTRL